MKRIVLLIILAVGLSMAGIAQNGFKIVGDLGGTLGGKLMLVASTAEGLVKLGETEMVEGKFEFSGSVEGLTLAYILTDRQQPIATLMLENRDFLLVAGATGIEVQGSEQQTVWNRFEAMTREMSRKQMLMEQQAKAAYAAQNQMQLQVIQSDFEAYAAEVRKKQNELLETYKDAPAAACFVALTMEQLDYKGLSEWYGVLGEGAKTSFFGKAVAEKLAALRNLEVGGTAPDFRAATLNGDSVSLYGIAGKVKLVDFWASWCGPCRAENPNVRKIYDKYHAAGLEIIGVSLDTKKQDWAKAIRDDKLSWIHVSDLGGWQSELGRLYAVKAVPCIYLLDEHNRVVAKNLRGKALQKKIEEIIRQ